MTTESNPAPTPPPEAPRDTGHLPGRFTSGFRRITKAVSVLTLRWVTLSAFAVWFGGFTFYSAVVIPVLHDELGGLGQGGITGQVSDTLNDFGLGAVLAFWVLVVVERSAGEPWARWTRVALLGATSVILLGLIALHPVLDTRLDSGPYREFRRLHQIYLIASTAEWGINLALLAVTLRIWQTCELMPKPLKSTQVS